MSNSATILAMASQTPAQLFSQSMQQVQAYAQAMANFALTGDSNIDPVLTKCKNDAAQWYNTIYPAYLNMPNTLGTDAPAITNGLQLLVQLAGQLQATPGSTPIRQNINTEAASLQQTVQGMQQQVSGLGTALNTFNTNLATDNIQLNNGLTQLGNESQNLSNQINQQYGQLNSLQHATCPSSASIEACQQLIQKLIDQYNNVGAIISSVNNLQNTCSTAVQGLGYLGGFWQTAAADAANCIAALIQMQRDPDSALQIDLQKNQAQWNQFITLMQQVGITAAGLLKA